MGDSHSVTLLLTRLNSPDAAEAESAAAELWTRFAPPLVAMARRRMAPDVRRRTDAEDVVQSVYRSFFDRQKRGEFEIRDRDDLRALLARITLNKVRNAAIRERRQVRDARRERHDAGAGAEDSFGSPLAALEGREPTPEEAAMLEEDGARLVAAVAELIDALDERLQRVARWKLEGLTNREIAGADRLDCSERNVERMVAAIRRKWGAVSSLEI